MLMPLKFSIFDVSPFLCKGIATVDFNVEGKTTESLSSDEAIDVIYNLDN